MKNNKPQLKRTLNTSLLTLYGLGVTVGAGIYVLIGATANKAGLFAPISFLLAATVVAFTGFSYAELSTRYPVSSGESAYIIGGFNSNYLAIIIGFMVISSGVVSSATVSIGAAAYLQHFISMPNSFVIALLLIVIALIAIWGILESVLLAAIITIIEIIGLIFVIMYAFTINPNMLDNAALLVPSFSLSDWSGIFAAGLLAFFAFVGFEDIANVAEEVKNPPKTMPRAILLTLIISTILYFAVVAVLLLTVPLEKVVNSSSPLAVLFENARPEILTIFSAIASLATINGVLIQMIMASRVLYGLAVQGFVPNIFARINMRTKTPIYSTVLIALFVLVLAVFVPLEFLAKLTSQIVLVIFMVVNAALIRIKRKEITPKLNIYQVPIWVPFIGIVSCILLTIFSMLFN